MFTLSANSGWFDGDSYQRYFEAARFGFSALEELGWKHLDLTKAKETINQSGVQLSAILAQTEKEDYSELLSFNHGIVYEDAVDAFKSAVEESLSAALFLGVKNIVVTTGNERKDVSRYVQHTNIVTALREADKIISGSGVKLVLEPLNTLVDHKGYYLVYSNEAADIIDEVNSDNIKMLFDIYHQQISEGNIINNIKKYQTRIGHFHVGDVPGRNEPGSGELNYKNIFKAIKDIGYDGFVTFECGRTKDAETVCKEMLSLVSAL